MRGDHAGDDMEQGIHVDQTLHIYEIASDTKQGRLIM